MSSDEAFAADAAGNVDIEVAFPITGRSGESGEIRVYELPGGTMAEIVHRGAYGNATATYEKLFAWLESNHTSIVGALREGYLNDPREVPVEEILTEVYAPIG
ncbi:MAG: GyrI-like domain-containing protein [Methanomicrobiaceae archaeon]|nr:GyrI-like domain-containing protein [Methanomicrobiaceae archaeon]